MCAIPMAVFTISIQVLLFQAYIAVLVALSRTLYTCVHACVWVKIYLGASRKNFNDPISLINKK